MFRRRKPEDDLAAAIYKRVGERARTAELFEGCGIPDTLDGRFDSLALHAALMIDRLRREPDGEALSQACFDAIDDPDYGGARARRISPFVLEALDLPAAAVNPARGVTLKDPTERLAAFGAVDAPVAIPRGPIEEPLSLSYYQIDDYLTCPRKYQYAHVLRVPLAPHHAIVYGAALHKAVQLFHVRHARGEVMSEAELLELFESAWSNEGFVSREHEEARLEAGRSALRRFHGAHGRGRRPSLDRTERLGDLRCQRVAVEVADRDDEGVVGNIVRPVVLHGVGQSGRRDV